ncbi:hypothetical protein [Haladaptatus caseinilyticus]|nr:hypothetical protein [Haladaptatus caseinilyticus]
MTNSRDQYETVFCQNGWVEIRNPEQGDQWIAIDVPTEVRR